jgi:hypothetical protein
VHCCPAPACLVAPAALCDLAGAVAGSRVACGGSGAGIWPAMARLEGGRRGRRTLDGGRSPGEAAAGRKDRDGWLRQDVGAGQELSLPLGCGPAAAGRRGAGQSRMTAAGYRERGAGKCRPGCGISGLQHHGGQPRRPAAAHRSQTNTPQMPIGIYESNTLALSNVHAFCPV